MAAAVEAILGAERAPGAKLALFRERLAQLPGEQGDLIAALLEAVGLDPPGAVQCLSACYISARAPLCARLLEGGLLARALRGAGDRGPALADLAGIALKAAPTGSLGATAAELWPALARLAGAERWERLPPSPARASAVRLWSRCPELAPPGLTAQVVALWIAQPDAPEAERAALEKFLHSQWGSVAEEERAKVALTVLCEGIDGPELTPSWFASVVARPPATVASASVCGLVIGVLEPVRALAAVFLEDPNGAAALLFAWVTLCASALRADAAQEAQQAFDFLGGLCWRMAEKRRWAEVVAALLYLALHAAPGSAAGALARRLLADLPSAHPTSPLACVAPLILEVASGGAAAEPRPAKAPAGLRNLGNTCYLNSLLQALALTRRFAAALFEACSAPGQSHRVRGLLAQVLTSLHVARAPVSPAALAMSTPFGLTGQQQDATELAQWLLDQVGDVAVDGSITQRCFGGKFRTTVVCSGCGHAQEKVESFSDLCLPMLDARSEGEMGGALSVARLLRAFFQEEQLSGYRCDSCQAVDTSKRRCGITRPPEHLMLALNRFSYSASGQQEKLDVHVSVDKQLALPMEGTDLLEGYALYAVVLHIGSSPHAGHYICVGRSSEDEEALWQRFDDCTVASLPLGETSQEALDRMANGSKTAYVLLYRRQGAAAEALPPLRPPPRLFAEAVLAEADAPRAEAPGLALPPVVPLGPSGGPPPDTGPGPGGPPMGGGWIC